LFHTQKTPQVLNNIKKKNIRKFTCAVHAAHWIELEYITYCSLFYSACG